MDLDATHPVFSNEDVVGGDQWRRLRPQIAEKHSSQLLNRIGRVANRILVIALRGFCGLLKTPATYVIFPPVIGTADAVRLDSPIEERRTSVGALLAEQAVPSLAVFEEHQILAQKPDLLLPVFIDLELRRERHPVAPKKLSHGRPGANARDKLICVVIKHFNGLPPQRHPMSKTFASASLLGRSDPQQKNYSSMDPVVPLANYSSPPRHSEVTNSMILFCSSSRTSAIGSRPS